MELVKVQGTSKNGKEWTGYRLKLGKFQTPLFFPSDVDVWYIQEYLKKQEEE